MFVIIGIVIVFASVIGGYLMEQGNLALLFQPAEMVIIFGAAIGGFIISSPMKVIKAVKGGVMRMFKGKIYSSSDYIEALVLLSEIFYKIRKEGLVSIESDLDEPDNSAPAQLSRTAVKDKPYIVSETNEPFPNDHAAEFIPILAAYGLLQDWDGISFYDYDGTWWRSYWQNEEWRLDRIPHHFEIGLDPVKMPQMAAGALMFLRGDVQPARQTVERTATQEWLLDSLRVQMPVSHPYWLPHLPGRLALVHRTVLADFNAEAVRPAEGEVTLPAGTVLSDTGELTWESAADGAHVRIDTPSHQAVIGRAGRQETGNMVLDLETPFAAVQLASLEERPIAQAGRLLLIAGGRVANRGMRWADAERHSIEEWGEGPTTIEPVVARLTLRGLQGAQAVTLQPLDGSGQPMGEAIPFTAEGRGFGVALTGEPATPWYLVQVTR